MFKPAGLFFSFLVAAAGGLAAEPAASPVESPAPAAPARKMVVYVIPVREEINKPTLFILRRGLKEAMAEKADAVLLDMDTPGGALDVTFEIMETLEKFPGRTITFVNTDAISAGAFISATTDEIWFSPRGKIGAAAPVLATGGEIDKSMKQKIVSFLRAEVRSVSEGKGYRGQVISAMIDEDYELKIGDKVLKPKGELLTLTASEALEKYGEPPQALLGAGKAADVEALLAAKYGAGNYEIKSFKVTWLEKLAQHLTALSPVLLGLGLLALFIEFKTPGFGLFGITGIVLLAVVFLSSYVAGFSGHEPLLVFAVGLLLVGLELFFFPGVFVVAMLGICLMLGSLVWAMADLWPGEPLTVAWSGNAFVGPLQNLGLGLLLAGVMGAALIRYLPRGWVWDKLVVGSAIGGAAQVGGLSPQEGAAISSLIGRRGVAVTALRPGGQIEIDGKRFEAKVEVGAVNPGEAVIVRSRTDFALVVEKAVS